MSILLRGYLRLLERYPLRTQAVSTGVLMGTGDVIAQFVVERRPLVEYQFSRTSRFLLFGTFVGGPALRGWYLTLERIVKFTGPKAALAKVVLDQSLFAPMFCGLFLTTMGYWRTKSVDATKQLLNESYVDVMIANYKCGGLLRSVPRLPRASFLRSRDRSLSSAQQLWPAAQIFNFYLVPFQHRIMYVNCVALLWNTYLAWKAEQTQVDTQRTPKEGTEKGS